MPLSILILARCLILHFSLVDLRFRDRHHGRGQFSELLERRFLALRFSFWHQTRIRPCHGLRNHVTISRKRHAPGLPHVNRSVSGALHQRDCMLAIRLVPVALTRGRDDFIVRGLQVPTPLPNVVFEDHIIHIVVDHMARPLQSPAKI